MNASTGRSEVLAEVTVVNGFPDGFGVGTYARCLYDAIGDVSEFINLPLITGVAPSSYPGTVLNPILGRIESISGSLGGFANLSMNWGLGWRAFKGGARIRREALARDRILHYTDPAMYPAGSKRSVVTVHDLSTFGKRLRLTDIYSRTVNRNLISHVRSSVVNTDTSWVAKQLLQIAPDAQIKCVSPSVRPDFRPVGDKVNLRKRFDLPQDKYLLLSVSSAAPRKNLSIIPKILKVLGGAFKLVRVGQGLEADYCFSNLSYDEMNLLYNASDVLLFPSLDEGFGYPVVEAMAAGLPVVASDIEVLREVTAGAACLVDRSIESFCEAVREAVQNPRPWIDHGRQRAEFFSTAAFRTRLEKAYSEA
jgi:glycosyltransferase involved in cell wall biosynthesis